MKLYKLEQDVISGYDTYNSIIVCAKDADEARLINPQGDELNDAECGWVDRKDKDKIKVTLLGEAVKGLKKGLILDSYRSG